MKKNNFLIIALCSCLSVFFLMSGMTNVFSVAIAEGQHPEEDGLQIVYLNDENIKEVNYLSACSSYEDLTIRGITFSWDKDKRICSAVGTADNQWAYTQLYYNDRGFPEGMEAGKTYRIRCKTTSEDLNLTLGVFLDGQTSKASISIFTEDDIFTVPENATGLFARIYVNDRATVNDTISDIAILSYVSNEELLGSLETVTSVQQQMMNEIGSIKAANSYDYLSAFAKYADASIRGVKFSWNEDKTECTAVGTATSPWAFTQLYYNDAGLPEGIEPGKTYHVTCKSTDENLYFVIGAFLNGATSGSKVAAFTQNGQYTVPEEATGMYIRIAVYDNMKVNGTISNLSILSASSNEALTENVSYYGKDFLKSYGKYTDLTVNGVSFHWEDTKLLVNGTAADTASYYMYNGPIPEGMEPGDNFIIKFSTDSSGIGVEYSFMDSTQNVLQSGRSPDASSFSFIVPQNAAAWSFRIYISKGRSADNICINGLKVVKLTPRAMEVPLIVSFVDDDISSEELVRKYHDACCHNGVKGTYAVVTKKIENKDVDLATLLAYEDEGFGMCVHCYLQGGAPEWRVLPRTSESVTACRANLAKALRQMREYGFVNYNYWITPFGHKDAYLRQIAQELGVECLISINNSRHNSTRDADRWFIRRVQLKWNDEKSYATMDLVKGAIDAAVADGGGWLIITTHFNEGWGTLEWDETPDENGYPTGYARFNEMVQYALNAGFVSMTVEQAWQYYEPIIEANYEECLIAGTD